MEAIASQFVFVEILSIAILHMRLGCVLVNFATEVVFGFTADLVFDVFFHFLLFLLLFLNLFLNFPSLPHHLSYVLLELLVCKYFWLFNCLEIYGCVDRGLGFV